ncbi:hypothetical protein PHLCEN_2v1215 [Hermanssonia centrifuga]|uniref:Protein kinase domain-containing protein n=1 Tax=Hermanssonia centrifuga TaxID=98765 RepID=A0A2R6S402_9APHY|nr:hypothetical protein PHLCEN_2v1215 [Hermanssonia centrifuga]
MRIKAQRWLNILAWRLKQQKAAAKNTLIASVQPLRIKLADFGLAKVLQHDQGFETKVGTPQFMAPEILGKDGYNKLVDSFALGGTIFLT